MIKPLPIDRNDRQKRLDKAVQSVNDEITLAIVKGWTECKFPIKQGEPFYKEVRQIFKDAGYEIIVNIYARRSSVSEKISW